MANKVKVIKVTQDVVKWEEAMNNFGSEHNVFATQTSVNVLPGNIVTMVYVAVMFYKG